MLLILTLIILFFLFPLPAWAYFDPGFGGYLINYLFSLIVSGLAFVSAAIIYFFRTFIRQTFLHVWQKHEKICLIVLLSFMGLGSYCLGSFISNSIFKLSVDHPDPQVLSSLPITRTMDPPRIFKGYNLYNGKLFDENGRIVKQWSEDYLGAIDKNGDYYGGRDQGDQDHQEPSWGRYTWDDRVIWEKHFFIHHELYLSPQGTVFTFNMDVHDYNNYKVYFDNILEFDKNGQLLQRYSFWDHLKDYAPYHAKYKVDLALLPQGLFPWHDIFKRSSKHPLEYFHINSMFILPPNPLEGKGPAFRRGNWLISIFYGSMVFILDQDTKKILWHAVSHEVEGGLEGQHSASMLPDGNILLFDNGIDRKASRVLVIDPLTLKVKWQYSHKDFFSHDQGFVQALPNGNFLVTDSKKGHVFELTLDKKTVWDYSDTIVKHDSMYRVTRYPKEMIDRLLQQGSH